MSNKLSTFFFLNYESYTSKEKCIKQYSSLIISGIIYTPLLHFLIFQCCFLTFLWYFLNRLRIFNDMSFHIRPYAERIDNLLFVLFTQILHHPGYLMIQRSFPVCRYCSPDKLIQCDPC